MNQTLFHFVYYRHDKNEASFTFVSEMFQCTLKMACSKVCPLGELYKRVLALVIHFTSVHLSGGIQCVYPLALQYRLPINSFPLELIKYVSVHLLRTRYGLSFTLFGSAKDCLHLSASDVVINKLAWNVV